MIAVFADDGSPIRRGTARFAVARAAVDLPALHATSDANGHSVLDVGPFTVAAARAGHLCVGVADRGGLFQAWRLCFRAHAAGVKPVVGLRVWVDLAPTSEHPDIADVVLLAATESAYQRLLKIAGWSSARDDAPLAQPRALDALVPAIASDVVVLLVDTHPGCGGPLPMALEPLLVKRATRLAAVVGRNRVHLEILVGGWWAEAARVDAIRSAARRAGVGLVGGLHATTVEPSLLDAADIAIAVGTASQQKGAPQRFRSRSLLIDDANINRYQGLDDVLAATSALAEMLPDQPLPVCRRRPRLANLPLDNDLREQLLVACQIGARRLGLGSDSDVTDRVALEANWLSRGDLGLVLLACGEAVAWGNERALETGPVLGGIGGLLSAYLLGLSAYDPREYQGLMPEMMAGPAAHAHVVLRLDVGGAHRDAIADRFMTFMGSERAARAGCRRFMPPGEAAAAIAAAVGIGPNRADELATAAQLVADGSLRPLPNNRGVPPPTGHPFWRQRQGRLARRALALRLGAATGRIAHPHLIVCGRTALDKTVGTCRLASGELVTQADAEELKLIGHSSESFVPAQRRSTAVVRPPRPCRQHPFACKRGRASRAQTLPASGPLPPSPLSRRSSWAA